MLRAVLDTNVIVSAALNPRGVPFQVQSGFFDGRWQLLASQDILDEYESVLLRPRLRLPPAVVKDALARLRHAAILVFPASGIRACADPDDDKFLSCALAGAATHVVTGNLRHFPKGGYQGVRIVSPAEFLALSAL